jgi:hypothetical protein
MPGARPPSKAASRYGAGFALPPLTTSEATRAGRKLLALTSVEYWPRSVNPVPGPVNPDRRIGMPTNSIGIRRRWGAEHPFSCPLRGDRLVRVHYKILAVRRGGGGWSPGRPAVGCAAACTARIGGAKDLGRQLCTVGDFPNVAVGLHSVDRCLVAQLEIGFESSSRPPRRRGPAGVIAAPVPTAAGAGAVAEDGGVPPVAEPGTPLVTSIGSRVTGADGSFEVEYEDAEFQVVGAPSRPRVQSAPRAPCEHLQALPSVQRRPHAVLTIFHPSGMSIRCSRST